MKPRELIAVIAGCFVCFVVFYVLGKTIGRSKGAIVIIAGVLALAVLGYLYLYEKENWKVRFLEFIFIEVIIAGFIWEAWFK